MDSRGLSFILGTLAEKYSYRFSWLSRPIIQYPQDIVAVQELIWAVEPDLVIETGIAHGGSLVLSASLLVLLEYRDAVAQGRALDPAKPRRRVIGIDIEIRPPHRAAIEAHPMSSRITMVTGSSVAPDVIARVRDVAAEHERIIVMLDSNHTHDHVLQELEAYAPMASIGSYCIVFDSIIEDLPKGSFPDRPWDRGNNPKTAVTEYLRRLEMEGRAAADGARIKFELDASIEKRLLITVAPGGFLRRVS